MENTLAVSEAKQSHGLGQRFWRIFSDVIIYIILALMSIIWLAPVVWLFLQSLSADGGQSSMARLWPEHYTLNNYVWLFENKYPEYTWASDGTSSVTLNNSIYNFFGYVKNGSFYMGAFLNTLVIALFTMVISTFLTLATSYAFSRLRFKARTGMMKTILILGMFPGFLGMIILYWIFKMMGLGQTIWELIIIYSGGAGMGYYISKGFFDTISKQIDEAAMVDGASRWQIFYKITLPLSKPIVVYTALTSFMGPWAEYITASYMLRGQTTAKDNWTVAVLLKDMTKVTDGTSGKYWCEFCAGAVIVAIPTSLLFVFLQKNYVSGVSSGAVKG
jgi:arabinogalactan oligomer/maltooligosaccharide transport system permease protein